MSGEWFEFSRDDDIGRRVIYRILPDGTYEWHTQYRVDATLDVNAAQRNLAQPGWKGDYHHVASISPGVYWDKLHEAVRQGDDKYLSRWLNDSDNRAWRTKEGNV